MRLARVLRALLGSLALTCGWGCDGCGGARDGHDPAVVAPPTAEPANTKTALEPLPAPDCKARIEPVALSLPTLTEDADLRAARHHDDAAEPLAISAGPIVGLPTDTSARLWVRTSGATPVHVVIWPQDDPQRKRTIAGPTTSAAHDHIAVVDVPELQPGTAYHYQVVLGSGDDPAAPRKAASFRTLRAAGTPGKLRIAFGDTIAGDEDMAILREVAAAKPDLVLLLGDLIYADNLESNAPAYFEKYERNFQISALAELLQSVPTAMVWDDHDIKDNFFKGASARYRPARLAYELYVQSHNPPPVRAGHLHYTFQAGDVSFFVLDTRSHRSNPRERELPEKTMLGAAQKADLARFLACAPGTFKVVVSSVPFSSHVRGSEGFRGFAAERGQLFAFIAEHKVDNLVLLSGDQQWSAVFMHNRKQGPFVELMASPLSKRLGRATKQVMPSVLARDDDHHVFGVVDFDTTATPPTVAFTLCAHGKPCSPGQEQAPTTGLDVEGAEENVPFTIRFSADELGP